MQHVDTGEVMMQAYADRAAINETLQTKCAACILSYCMPSLQLSSFCNV